MATDQGHVRGGSALRSTVSAVAMFLVLAALMFVPAGIGWRAGWAFLLVFVILSVISAGYLWHANADIFIARGRIRPAARSWDTVLIVLLLVAFASTFVTAGLDARFGWSLMPLWLIVTGYVLFAVGFALSTWVYAVNRFAEPSVRIQSERGHTVVDTGPYAVVRHPLYAASFFVVTGMPLAMGSWWALVPVGVGTVVLIVRTVLEDRLLQSELAGYRDYTSRVRYRLVPGVW